MKNAFMTKGEETSIVKEFDILSFCGLIISLVVVAISFLIMIMEMMVCDIVFYIYCISTLVLCLIYELLEQQVNSYQI